MATPEDIHRIMRGAHHGCARGNGDGLGTMVTTVDPPREAFCLCDLCRVSRYRRREALAGRLTPEQGAAIDDLIAHLLEPPTTEDGMPVMTVAPEDDPEDAEHEGDFS
jgi:hypothetical protein